SFATGQLLLDPNDLINVGRGLQQFAGAGNGGALGLDARLGVDDLIGDVLGGASQRDHVAELFELTDRVFVGIGRNLEREVRLLVASSRLIGDVATGCLGY